MSAEPLDSRTGGCVNIAGYKFVALDDLAAGRKLLNDCCDTLELKGTILLSPEGINFFLAGSREGIDEFLTQLRKNSQFADLEVKESLSESQPFQKLYVKIKQEIIPFGVDGIRPEQSTSSRISPQRLKAWLDEGADVALLDVRNAFEADYGRFAAARTLPLENFRDFPEVAAQLSEDLKQRPLVLYCTGGIRCEKAGPWLERQGFREVYQLDGGILKYFEECGNAHFEGDCFVFDERVAVDSQLQPTSGR